MGVEGIEVLKGETGTEDQPDPDVTEVPEGAPPIRPDEEGVPEEGDDQEAGRDTEAEPVEEGDLVDVEPEEDGA